MDLDFKSVKALASPTRLEILNRVLEEEATTTKLSDDLDKSKSTVSSHLKVLTESGLLEKDEEEGRRRVVYRPTDKAEAIIQGKERKVKFSVVSSALTATAGIFFIERSLRKSAEEALRSYSAAKPEAEATATLEKGAEAAADSGASGGGQMGTMSMETANRTIDQAANATTGSPGSHVFQAEQALLVLGAGLLVTSVLALGYGYLLRKIRG